MAGLLRDSVYEDNNAGLGWVAAPPHPYVHMETMEATENESKESDSARRPGLGCLQIRQLPQRLLATVGDNNSCKSNLKQKTRTGRIYFCCDSGESRSTALAAAWMHYSEQDEMRIWKNIKYHPNELVYYLQSVACGLPITRDDAHELAEYNRLLFHNAISKQRSDGVL